MHAITFESSTQSTIIKYNIGTITAKGSDIDLNFHQFLVIFLTSSDLILTDFFFL
jgi:hypothetical protein